MKSENQPEQYQFEDDGVIPNSKLPVLVYHQTTEFKGDHAADWMEKRFAQNNWSNSWRWGIYPFHHYHSNTHEVLGVYKGEALLLLGGETGMKVQVRVGDVLILPAGTGHKCISHSEDFGVVGAYPGGIAPDLNKGREEERPAADYAIAKVPVPESDPLQGTVAGLPVIWQ